VTANCGTFVPAQASSTARRRTYSEYFLNIESSPFSPKDSKTPSPHNKRQIRWTNERGPVKYTATYVPQEQQSTRIKDLIDLLLIADLAAPHASLATTFSTRERLPLPTALPPPPISWATPYARAATDVGLTADLETAYAEAATFLDAILTGTTTGHWNSMQKRWKRAQAPPREPRSPPNRAPKNPHGQAAVTIKDRTAYPGGRSQHMSAIAIDLCVERQVGLKHPRTGLPGINIMLKHVVPNTSPATCSASRKHSGT
jgi:hypothetical protein